MINSLTAQMKKIVQKVSFVGEAESLRSEMASSKIEIVTIQSKIGVLKKAFDSSNTQIIQKTSKKKVKVPNSKPFQGNRNLKE